jgi:mono/diheme cytochrome c family protein/glucose/arabinose dehydrogenase
MMLLRTLRVLGALGALVVPSFAQIGDKSDKKGEVQKLIVPRELIPPSPVRTPAEELKTFQLAPGLRVELAAADPLVQDPVAMAIDPRGRMWVVEMRSYMPDLDGNGEDLPTGRVSVLEDTDGDGFFEKGTVFLDQLIMPRAICLVRDGALVGAPPKLWFCRDTNGDLKCDEQTEVAGDYGIQVDPKRPELANPERAPNSPLWALDNWIYSAAYTAKFRWRGGRWERGVTTFRGQWGLSQDDFGRLYHGSNSDQLRCDVVPSHYLGRNPNFPRPAGANVKVPENQFVWPARVNPGINRGYRPEMLRDGRLKEFTAACAHYVYRGDLLGPEFYGNAFVCEPAGNLIKRNILTDVNGSVAAREAYHQREFLASTDERFRPVNLYTGPDGALYVVDLYRGVLQHRISLTSYLRKQSEERGLDKGIRLGRIWRVVPAGKPVPRMKPDFAKETPAQWVNHLSHANAWWRETAQRLLVEAGDLSVLPALETLATRGAAPLGRVHALWTIEGLRQVNARLLATAFKDPEPRVRVAAIRVGERLFDGEDKPEVVAKLLGLADDPAPQVQLQLALTLGEARDPRADAVMAALVKRHGADNRFLADAVATGLFGRELELLEKLCADAAWSQSPTNTDKFLGTLARCAFAERRPERVERLLTLIARQPRGAAQRQLALLDGVMSAAASSRKPVKFAQEPPVLADLRELGGASLKTRVARLDASLVWPGKPGVPPEPVIPPLTAAQQARYELGKELFTGTCAACHQTHGLGLEGLAPPLADSEWVLGSEQRLIRIVLHGVSGPLKVKGASYSLDMPAMGMFDDEQTAAILTYIRREWEHGAPPVEPATVKRIRRLEAGRTDAWRQEELLKLP